MKIETIRRKARAHYNRRLALGDDSSAAGAATLHYINAEFDEELGGTYGVESLRPHTAYYVNTGETYRPTILFDSESCKFYAMSWGDFVEWQHVRFSE